MNQTSDSRQLCTTGGRFRIHTLARNMVMVAAALFALAQNARSALLNNTTGLTDPVSVITFEEIVLAEAEEILNSYQALGVTFAPGMRMTYVNYGVPHGGPPSAINFPGFVTPVKLQFTSPLTSVAMVIATNIAAPDTLITALLGGAVVESFEITTSQSGETNFFGFTGIVFDEVWINNGQSAIVVDSIQFGTPIPEPSSSMLAGSVLLTFALSFLRRRKRV